MPSAASYWATTFFYGHGFTESLAHATARTQGATVFGYHVQDPERYGVVSFNAQGRAIEITGVNKEYLAQERLSGCMLKFSAEALHGSTWAPMKASFKPPPSLKPLKTDMALRAAALKKSQFTKDGIRQRRLRKRNGKCRIRSMGSIS
jgi:hypothetical protein